MVLSGNKALRRRERKRTFVRVLPLTARVNLREILAYVLVIALLFVVVSRKSAPVLDAASESAIQRRRPRAEGGNGRGSTPHLVSVSSQTSLHSPPKHRHAGLPVERAGGALGVDLFASRVVLRNGGENAAIANACSKLADIIISKYLELRPEFLGYIDQETSLDASGKPSAVSMVVKDVYKGDRGALLNNAFYSWQQSQRQNADTNYRYCMWKAAEQDAMDEGATQACAKQMVADEWPEMYNSEAYKMLTKYVFETAAAYDDRTKENPDDRVYSRSRGGLMDVWFSVHTPGMFHNEHDHEDSSIAGTMYLQASGDCGRIVFIDPRKPRSLEDERARRGVGDEDGGRIRENDLFDDGRRGFSVKPTVGSLLLFPPWLYHQVERTKRPNAKKNDKEHTDSTSDTNTNADAESNVWENDTERSLFRVAMSFNIGRTWTTSVDYSIVDVLEPRVRQMLRADTLLPTRQDDFNGGSPYRNFVNDGALRDRLLATSRAADFVTRTSSSSSSRVHDDSAPG